MKKFLLTLVAVILLITTQSAVATPVQTPQIWLDLGGLGKPVPSQSWNILFLQPDAPWPEFMNHVASVGILTQVLERISDADLAKVVARLKEKHIGLGIEMLAQAYTLPGVDAPAHCGEGVEGYYAPFATAALAAKLKRAGGTPQYISMDEPLWFGHYYTEKNACHSSIEEVAERVAANLREYIKVFPDVIISDSEPFPSITDQLGWQNDYKEWLQAFYAKVGKPLSFSAVDINWGHTNWPQSLRAFTLFAHDVHISVGIIYNTAPPNQTMTNEEWLNNAQRNYAYIEKTLGITPNWAVFSSWVKFPGRTLSVDGALGEEYLIEQYLKLHGVQQ
jgi:hypothetical protein